MDLRLTMSRQFFAAPTISFEDDRADYGERRLITLGVLAGRVDGDSAHAPWRKHPHNLFSKGEPT